MSTLLKYKISPQFNWNAKVLTAIQLTTILCSYIYIQFPNFFSCQISLHNLITYQWLKLCYYYLKLSEQDNFIAGMILQKYNLLYCCQHLGYLGLGQKFRIFPEEFFLPLTLGSSHILIYRVAWLLQSHLHQEPQNCDTIYSLAIRSLANFIFVLHVGMLTGLCFQILQVS